MKLVTSVYFAKILAKLCGNNFCAAKTAKVFAKERREQNLSKSS